MLMGRFEKDLIILFVSESNESIVKYALSTMYVSVFNYDRLIS